ncbi:MoaD/ThiS family protein [Maricaulis sp.]|uniref:MoaD/ThiS family protein n=1 Tax=unclassified Maricaulis TaxID=2632371 RepID=UPI001B0A6F04|nr:MoaD/ThiS family protein [Maricaulis sp.]MBO6798531.1 MoaD/ThiS family protein [Maricaulis sp.]
MSLTVRYFAALRERMGTAEEAVDTPATTGTELIAWLIERDSRANVLEHPSTRIIVNDEIVSRKHALKAGDVVAFCPPFSGG